MEGIPGLTLSSGPAMSEAMSGGSGPVGTGAFNFKPQRGLVESLAPWAALAVVAWLVLR